MLAIAGNTAKLNGLTFFEGTWAEKIDFFYNKKIPRAFQPHSEGKTAKCF